MKDYIVCERYHLDTQDSKICRCETLEEAKQVVDNHRNSDHYLQYSYTIYKTSKETNKLERVEY
ncbi:hypothetical protein ACWG0P_07040 [Amedibacillus sp. YH-ame6]